MGPGQHVEAQLCPGLCLPCSSGVGGPPQGDVGLPATGREVRA